MNMKNNFNTDNQADLSRTVGKVRHYSPLLDMPLEEYFKLAMDITKADKLTDLPADYQKLIKQAIRNATNNQEG